MRESNRDLLGDEVVSQIDEVYGLDEEGELDGSYRPCGYPGVRLLSPFTVLSHDAPPRIALVRDRGFLRITIYVEAVGMSA